MGRLDLGIYVGPDNGIECADLRDTQARSRKFVFRSEIQSLVLQGKSVVVYHHTGRLGGTAEEQTRRHLQNPVRRTLSAAAPIRSVVPARYNEGVYHPAQPDPP